MVVIYCCLKMLFTERNVQYGFIFIINKFLNGIYENILVHL